MIVIASFAPVERAGADDLMSLAAERGPAPMQVGAVLMLNVPTGLDPGLVADAIAHRVLAVLRLRQRLVTVPWRYGRPEWVDDQEFAVTNHFSVVHRPAPGRESDVLGVAAEMLLTRLPRDRPLWAATLVTDAGQRGAALIVVFHHVLADGIGGLAVLAALVDGAADVPGGEFPVQMPSLARHAVEAAILRLRSTSQLPAVVRRLRAAHAQQATVNDVVLSAVAAALHRLLASRGESVDEFVVLVPFSARRQASAAALGNHSGVIPLRVSGVGDPGHRLRSLAETTRAAKSAQRGSSAALLGPLFRLLAAAGLYRWFINRQRLIHTIAFNLRGPESRLSFLGCPITNVIPLSAAMGNVTVSYGFLSYAGTLTITVMADPDTCPELSELRDALVAELRVLAELGR